MPLSARERFLLLLRTAIDDGSLVKLTLGKPVGADPTLRNLFVRPVALKAGPRLSFLWRHDTRDVTKNLIHDEALAEIDRLLGPAFRDGHLFTASESVQLETKADGTARLHQKKATPVEAAPEGHDAAKSYLIPADAPWLRALGVTNERGVPREGMRDKFRQIQKFTELLQHLLNEAGLLPGAERSAVGDRLSSPGSQAAPPLHILDAGSGKGYLTFALAALLGDRAVVRGIEARGELVDLCNRIAREHRLANLTFAAGHIADAENAKRAAEIEDPLDVLIALHACDTATDDALARGIAADARLLVVAPCCQKELRPQLTAPPVLADALRHGIFQERTAEFVTDALRAQLLEWAGYRTKAFEFISTEHTAKNLMIAAIKTGPRGVATDARAVRVREFAAFYGIRHQALARHLGFALGDGTASGLPSGAALASAGP